MHDQVLQEAVRASSSGRIMLDWIIGKQKIEIKRQLRYCAGFGCKTVYFTPEKVSSECPLILYLLPAGACLLLPHLPALLDS